MCKQERDPSEFYKDAARKDGLMSRCKECDSKKQRKYRQTTKGRAVLNNAARSYHAKLKDIKNKLKSEVGCEVCGYRVCDWALEFHHVDGEGKERAVRDCKTIKQLFKETVQCIVVCANCHREIHAGMHPGVFIRCLHARKHEQKQIFILS